MPVRPQHNVDILFPSFFSRVPFVLYFFLKQCGSFVPCAQATIPLVRRLLARTGAMDAPAHGISSFMAEMLETATLLRRAGPRTLCLIDELGRGTSTHDGLGVSAAAIKHEYIIISSPLSRCNCLNLILDSVLELATSYSAQQKLR